MGASEWVARKIADGRAAREERARQQSFNKDVYHSTNQDYDTIDPNKGDIGFHVGTQEQANNRSKALQKSAVGYPLDSDQVITEKLGLPLHREGSNIMPLKLRTSGEVLEMPDIGSWHNSIFVARALAENRGGNVPKQLQDRAFAIGELIEDFMETDDAYEYAMDTFKWTSSPQNRGLLDELNKLIRDEGFSTIKYSNAYENTFLTKAAPRQEIVDRIDKLSQELATVADPVKREEIEAAINTAREEAMQSQVDDAYSYIALDPADVRSTFAEFNPEDSNSSGLMKGVTSVGLGTAFAGSMLAGQNAEASEVERPDYGSIEPMDTPWRYEAQMYMAELMGGDRSDYKRAEKLMSVFDFLPAIGDVQGAVDARDAFAAGDMVGGAINTVAAAMGIIPVIGDAAGKSLKEGADKLRANLPAPRTRAEVEAVASPDFGEVVQTRKAGETVEVPALEMQTAAGYPANPNVPLLLEGGYGDSVSKQSVTANRNKYEQNPTFRDMQDRRATGGRFTTTDDLYAQAATYEDLVDKPVMIIPADKTAGSGYVDRLAGRDIEPIHLQGGAFFGDRYGQWQSMEGAARDKQRHALNVAEDAKQLPIGLFQSMGHAGSNFSTMPSEGILAYIDAMGGLDREGIDYVDSVMSNLLNKGDTKGVSDDWTGYESTDQMRGWLFDTDAPKGKSTLGARRKAFVPKMMNVDMQDYGMLPPNDLYAPINEQVLRNVPSGYVGLRGAQFTDTPVEQLTPDNYAFHRSYDTPIPFSNVLSFDQPMIPWHVMFQDAALARAGKPAHNAARSFTTSGADYQMFREEDLKRVNAWLESLRQQE